MLRATTLVLIGALLTVLPDAASAQTAPPVPPNLEVPAGNTPFLIAHAYGTQNYICLRSGPDTAWTFFGPQATLFDDDGSQVITHYLSPNPVEDGTPRAAWQHSQDSSSIWAAAIANSTDPSFVEPGAIPWLLLRVVGAQYGPMWGDALTGATFIQRVNTSGGVAPATGCKSHKDEGKKALMPYTTDYVFYR